MALGTFIAGRYSATFNAVDVGMSRQGFELEFRFKQEEIAESDLFGLTTIDMIMRGADAFLRATLKEYKTGSLAALWQIGGAALGKIASAAVPIGVLASSLAQALVLTSTAATPAAAAPATLTGSLACLAPNYNPRIIFDSRLREVPIEMILLPSLSGGNLTVFSTT